MAHNLYLNCKQCGRQFFSGVDEPPPEPRAHECMRCHAAPEYAVEDYYLTGYVGGDVEAMS